MPRRLLGAIHATVWPYTVQPGIAVFFKVSFGSSSSIPLTPLNGFDGGLLLKFGLGTGLAICREYRTRPPQRQRPLNPCERTVQTHPGQPGEGKRLRCCSARSVNFFGGVGKLVPLAGLEPARRCHHLILSQARLPLPPQG